MTGSRFYIPSSCHSVIPSRSISPRRNPLRLTDRQLRHHLDQLPPRLVGILERVAEHLDVAAVFFRGDGEAVRRLVGARGGCPPPPAVDQLEAQKLRSLSGLEALRGLGWDAARIRFLLVERARDQSGQHLA